MLCEFQEHFRCIRFENLYGKPSHTLAIISKKCMQIIPGQPDPAQFTTKWEEQGAGSLTDKKGTVYYTPLSLQNCYELGFACPRSESHTIQEFA